MATPSTPTATGRAAEPATREQRYEHAATRELVTLVNDAAELVRAKGEAAFEELRADGSRWRRGETYVFVLDPEGNMLVHADPALEGRDELELKDVAGKPIVRGLIHAATAIDAKPEGWYHYQWPVPGGILPRWKSSYVRMVKAPSGRTYIVGSGMYNDRMEPAFVVDAVTTAVGEIERRGEAAFALLRDPTGPFVAKDAYVFVTDMNGVELVNPAFPNLEGRQLLDLKDTRGTFVNRELIDRVRTSGAGWVEYLWPRPGESVSTRKSTYVSRASLHGTPVMVGCGVYLEEATREARPAPRMRAPDLMKLVREAAAILEERGEAAYADLRKPDSKWRRDDTYVFVWSLDGTRVFHGAEPALEGQSVKLVRDILGRPYGEMILGAAGGAAGEGWVHYMHPRPGDIFPAWKSSFVKRVTYPSGVPHVVGSGIYNMEMDQAFIEDVVNRAAEAVAARGVAAFGELRDRRGPYVFMDTYVFVDSTDGRELVNPAFPSFEGMNLMDLKDARGKTVVRDEIAAALEHGSAWVECYWYKPGENTPVRKKTFVRAVRSGATTYVVGSGIYMD